MGLIVFHDRVRMAMQADREKRFLVLKGGDVDIMSFLMKYEYIFNNEEIMNDIIPYTKAVFKQRRSYEKNNVADILKQIQPGSTHFNQMRKYLKLGFAVLPLNHLCFYTALLFGFQTFDQMTKTNIIPNGQWCLDCRGSEKQLYSISIPKYPLPVSFPLYLAKHLGYQHINDYKQLISPGFHTFSAFLGTQEAFYKFSIKNIYLYIFIYIHTKYIFTYIYIYTHTQNIVYINKKHIKIYVNEMELPFLI